MRQLTVIQRRTTLHDDKMTHATQIPSYRRTQLARHIDRNSLTLSVALQSYKSEPVGSKLLQQCLWQPPVKRTSFTRGGSPWSHLWCGSLSAVPETTVISIWKFSHWQGSSLSL